jgi:hypothetical protein
LIQLSARQTLLFRMRAQRLSQVQNPSLLSIPQVLREVGGVQAQDLSAAALSVRARSSGLTAADVEKARQVDRTIVWTWALRGTLHLIDAADYFWMIPLLGPRFIASNRSRYRQLGFDEATLKKGSQAIREALASQGPLTRAEIGSRLEARSIPTEGQRLPHLIAHTALLGAICHGPDKEAEPTFTLVQDWIGPGQPLPPQAALASLARRYLAAFAPAVPRDLAAWSGASLAEAHQAFQQIEAETLQVEAAGQKTWMLKAQLAWLEDLTPEPPIAYVVRLLPWFDTYLMGYARRELVVVPHHWKRVNASGGILHPALLVDGRVVGVWSKKQRRDTLYLTLEPFEELDPDLRPSLESEAKDIARFLSLKLELQIALVR